MTTEREPRTAAGIEQLASMRRVVEEVREIAFPDQIGQPIPQESAVLLVRAIEDESWNAALDQIVQFIDSTLSVTPRLTGTGYSDGVSEGIHTVFGVVRELAASLRKPVTP